MFVFARLCECPLFGSLFVFCVIFQQLLFSDLRNVQKSTLEPDLLKIIRIKETSDSLRADQIVRDLYSILYLLK